MGGGEEDRSVEMDQDAVGNSMRRDSVRGEGSRREGKVYLCHGVITAPLSSAMLYHMVLVQGCGHFFHIFRY